MDRVDGRGLTRAHSGWSFLLYGPVVYTTVEVGGGEETAVGGHERARRHAVVVTLEGVDAAEGSRVESKT